MGRKIRKRIHSLFVRLLVVDPRNSPIIESFARSSIRPSARPTPVEHRPYSVHLSVYRYVHNLVRFVGSFTSPMISHFR